MEQKRVVCEHFLDMPCMKKFTKTNKRRTIGQQPGTKSASGPGYKPLVNRLSCSSIRLTWDFICSCLRRIVQEGHLRYPGEQDGRLFPGRIGPPPSPPRPAPLRSAHPAAVGRPAPLRQWYVQVLCTKLVEPKTRTHHGPVGSGRRTAGRRGGAGLGRTGRRWVDPARRQPSLLPSSESRKLS